MGLLYLYKGRFLYPSPLFTSPPLTFSQKNLHYCRLWSKSLYSTRHLVILNSELGFEFAMPATFAFTVSGLMSMPPNVITTIRCAMSTRLALVIFTLSFLYQPSIMSKATSTSKVCPPVSIISFAFLIASFVGSSTGLGFSSLSFFAFTLNSSTYFFKALLSLFLKDYGVL